MEACEVVRLFVNKVIVPLEPKRRRNPGYRRVKALRVLVYARLKGLDNDTRVIEYLKKHIEASRTLGLCRVQERTTFGRWWRRYLSLLEQTFINISDMLQLIEPTQTVIVDLTSLPDLYDVEARWVIQAEESSEASNFMQLGLPLRALITSATVLTRRFFQN
jgi:hypothetical protein